MKLDILPPSKLNVGSDYLRAAVPYPSTKARSGPCIYAWSKAWKHACQIRTAARASSDSL